MKKTTACTLIAGALSVGMAGQVSAGYSQASNKAHELRASAHAMNQRASQMEYKNSLLTGEGS